MYQAIIRLSDQMELVGRHIAELSSRSDDHSMRALIAARRELAGLLPQLVDACIVAIDGLKGGRQAELQADLRKLSSFFRHELANLQSEWPSVVIKSNPSGYALQKRKLAAAEQAFFGWLVDQLLPTLKAN